MRYIATLAAAAFVATTSFAAAGPMKLSDAQMDQVTAGGDTCVVCTQKAEITQFNDSKQVAFLNVISVQKNKQLNKAAIKQRIN